MNPLFFWSLAPSRSRPPSLRVPLRRLRRFFVRIPSDYGRFEVPRIIEEGGGAGFKERGERTRGGGSLLSLLLVPPAISTTEGRALYFMGRARIFTRTRVTRNPPPLTFRSDTVCRSRNSFARDRGILESCFDSSIKYQEMKRFVERIIVCERESKSKLFQFVSAIY